MPIAYNGQRRLYTIPGVQCKPYSVLYTSYNVQRVLNLLYLLLKDKMVILICGFTNITTDLYSVFYIVYIVTHVCYICYIVLVTHVCYSVYRTHVYIYIIKQPQVYTIH